MLHNNTLRNVARGIALVWAGWWIFFAIASTFSPPRVSQFPFVCLLMVLLFVCSALLPWRRQREGGMLLLVEGIALCIVNFTFLHNPPATRLFLLLTLALPPLLAGTLFLARHPHPERAS